MSTSATRNSDSNNRHSQENYERNKLVKPMSHMQHGHDYDYEEDDYVPVGECCMAKAAHEHCEYILAHSYVPRQIYHHVYSPEEALLKGTIFPELWGVYPIPD